MQEAGVHLAEWTLNGRGKGTRVWNLVMLTTANLKGAPTEIGFRQNV